MNTTRLMDGVRVPLRLLENHGLSDSAKLVWIILLLDSGLNNGKDLSKTRLANMSGLSRTSIYKALTELGHAGWFADNKPRHQHGRHGRTVILFTDLLLDTNLGIRTRLFHGHLQILGSRLGIKKHYRFTAIGLLIRWDAKTVKKATRELRDSGWISCKQANPLAPVSITLRHPFREQIDALWDRTTKTLSTSKHIGEDLMKALLSLASTSDGYADNTWPEFLRSKDTDYLMEFDRYYFTGIAFEFNGNQHYFTTERYDARTVERQIRRDELKGRICEERNITLIIIRPEDLSMEGILNKIGSILPLRNLWSAGPFIRFLENRCEAYRKNTPSACKPA